MHTISHTHIYRIKVVRNCFNNKGSSLQITWSLKKEKMMKDKTASHQTPWGHPGDEPYLRLREGHHFGRKWGFTSEFWSTRFCWEAHTLHFLTYASPTYSWKIY